MTGAASADEADFEILSATIDGRLTVAFVNQQGTAVALSLGSETPEIIRGVAAGAILSDLRDRAGEAMAAGRVTAAELATVIDDLPQLTAGQRQQLKAMLHV